MPKNSIIPSISDKWSLSRQLLKLNLECDELASERDQVLDLEESVLKGPIRSLDDAVAKLHAIELTFTDGERSDGADATALRQTIRWLRSNFASSTLA